MAFSKRSHVPASLAIRLDHVDFSNLLLSSGNVNDGNFMLQGRWSRIIEGAWFSDDSVKPQPCLTVESFSRE